MKEEAPIVTSGLSIGYNLGKGRRKVVHTGLDLTLEKGRVTCLLGLNGAGKSTLIKTICGFIEPLAGEVTLMGQPLANCPHSRLSKLVGVVLTEKSSAGGITVRELTALGRYPHTGFFGQLKDEDWKIVDEAMEAAGVSSKADSYIAELSDGERQKAFIAKVLAQECPVIILDEPTAFLDVTSRMETMVLLNRIAHTQGRTVLLSTHDLESAIQLADVLWLQEKDSPMVCGTPSELIGNGMMEKFFSRGNLRFDTELKRIVAISEENSI